MRLSEWVSWLDMQGIVLGKIANHSKTNMESIFYNLIWNWKKYWANRSWKSHLDYEREENLGEVGLWIQHRFNNICLWQGVDSANNNLVYNLEGTFNVFIIKMIKFKVLISCKYIWELKHHSVPHTCAQTCRKHFTKRVEKNEEDLFILVQKNWNPSTSWVFKKIMTTHTKSCQN